MSNKNHQHKSSFVLPCNMFMGDVIMVVLLHQQLLHSSIKCFSLFFSSHNAKFFVSSYKDVSFKFLEDIYERSVKRKKKQKLTYQCCEIWSSLVRVIDYNDVIGETSLTEFPREVAQMSLADESVGYDLRLQRNILEIMGFINLLVKVAMWPWSVFTTLSRCDIILLAAKVYGLCAFRLLGC